MKQNPHNIVRAISASSLLTLAVAGAAVSSTFTLTGCTSSETQRTTSTAFGQYQTFGFAPVSGSNGRAMSLAQNEVSQQLMARGLMPSNNPDLLVSVQVRANPIVRMPGNTNLGSAHANVNTSTEGHLTIDLTDARQKQVVWRGYTSQPITRKVLDNPERSMDRAVIDAFRSFPLRAR
ncbi:DUF4136 domain-containing protein [Microbulbifer pacificus]|uniref:DUF4136 domain-containing protein n=1 Tax=Microbulbifer pacificus TaxID=407164 RepID=UPI000CF53992|nr:DUF4136 domain-containing protein [Microbulbifer pacificus]